MANVVYTNRVHSKSGPDSQAQKKRSHLVQIFDNFYVHIELQGTFLFLHALEAPLATKKSNRGRCDDMATFSFRLRVKLKVVRDFEAI